MTKKKQTRQQQQKPATEEIKAQPSALIEGCSFTAISAANEHTRAAVEALAMAATANAEAIKAIAEAMKGGPATIERAINIGS